MMTMIAIEEKNVFVMKKIKKMLIGWGKRFGLLSVSTSEKRLADLRLTICKNCPESKSAKILSIINGNAEYEQTIKCSMCGCPCWEKTIVVDEICPLGKW